MGRVVVAVALLLIVLVGALGSAAVYAVGRTLPQTVGTLGVPGLHQSVSVVRDRWGVPHISATDLHDVAFAQGYAIAQDRLFQLEFNRRVAQGRLAEMFGAGPNGSLIHTDTFLRTLDLYGAARAEEPTLDPRTSLELTAYADGINAFVATHRDALPLEFTVLGIAFQPWTPVDSLAYGRVVALSLDGVWYVKYTRALLQAKLGSAATAVLLPPYPTQNPTLFAAPQVAAPLEPPLVGSKLSAAPASNVGQVASRAPAIGQGAPPAILSSATLQAIATLHSLLGGFADALGSNNWVVDGSRTTTGYPLLANDPHLGIQMPAIWYEVALRGGGLDVIGFSFPGEPGVVVGHNGYIGWGVTTVGADNTDLYVETLDPANHPGQYRSDGRWLPLTTRQETIRVRGAQPVVVTLAATQHGPLIDGAVSDMKGLGSIALRWAALQPGYSLRGFFDLDFAINWPQFLDAVGRIGISQNFVFADVDGNIGYRLSGLLPVRAAENGLLPVDGSTSANDWQGYVPQAQMPQLLNPPTHIIVTANNRIVPDNYPIFVSTDAEDQGYRARRIIDLLISTPRLSAADFERIQADVVSLPAQQFAPQFIHAGLAAGGDAAEGATLLSGWDGTMSRESTAAAVYEVATGTLAREVFEPVLGKDLYATYTSNYSSSGVLTALLALLAVPAPPFLADTAARDAAVARALGDAVAALRTRFGDDPTEWRWGQLHQAHFAHPLASVTPLNYIFDVAPLARSGDVTTINVGGDGGFSADPPSYAQHTVSSMREIFDFAHLDRSLWITTTGASGEPFSPHYSDLIPLWDQNRYQTMDYTPPAVARGQTDVLVLHP